MPDEPWCQEPTDLFLRRKEEFQKKRPMQLKAVLRNLARYQQLLDEQPIARLISANFIHPEKRGVVALTLRPPVSPLPLFQSGVNINARYSGFRCAPSAAD
jgi:hypothetical protein